ALGQTPSSNRAWPVLTPIAPVSVPGGATRPSAATEMYYPPEAATSLIDTTTGLPAARVLTTSRQMVSDATADPPGLLTRSSTARTRSSSVAARRAQATVSDPIEPPPNGLRPLRPCRIGPDA